jgi:hypothetical protein
MVSLAKLLRIRQGIGKNISLSISLVHTHTHKLYPKALLRMGIDRKISFGFLARHYLLFGFKILQF